MTSFARRYVLLAVAIVAGAYLGWLPLVPRLSFVPGALALALILLVAWYAWGELTVPRRPLDEPVELRTAVEQMAALAGLPLHAISVIDAEKGETDPGDDLAHAGEIVYLAEELADGMYTNLGRAARQIATAQAPPRYAWPGALVVGLGLGAILGLRVVLGSGLAASLLAMAALVGLTVFTAWLLMRHDDKRSKIIDARAAAVLAQMRTEQPWAFRELMEQQGLLPRATQREADTGEASAEAS